MRRKLVLDQQKNVKAALEPCSILPIFTAAIGRVRRRNLPRRRLRHEIKDGPKTSFRLRLVARFRVPRFRVQRRHAETTPKCAVKIRDVVEAGEMGDVADLGRPLPRIAQQPCRPQ